MPNQFEIIPGSNPSRQFPGGDIDAGHADRAFTLYCEITEGDEKDQNGYLRTMRQSELTSWRIFPDQDSVYLDIRALHKNWANQTRNPEISETIGYIGTFNIFAFISKSCMLPTHFRNFSDELKVLGAYDPATIKFFANESWALMQSSHPVTYDVLSTFAKYLQKANKISNDDELNHDIFWASSALPYLMASTTRMLGYLQQDTKYGIQRLK